MWPGRWLIPSSRTRRIPLNGFCGFTEEYPVKNTHWVRIFTVTRGSYSDCPRVYVRICSVLARKWPTEQLEQLGDMLNSSKVNLVAHKSGQRCPNADQNALTGDRYVFRLYDVSSVRWARCLLASFSVCSPDSGVHAVGLHSLRILTDTKATKRNRPKRPKREKTKKHPRIVHGSHKRQTILRVINYT